MEWNNKDTKIEDGRSYILARVGCSLESFVDWWQRKPGYQIQQKRVRLALLIPLEVERVFKEAVEKKRKDTYVQNYVLSKQQRSRGRHFAEQLRLRAKRCVSMKEKEKEISVIQAVTPSLLFTTVNFYTTTSRDVRISLRNSIPA